MARPKSEDKRNAILAAATRVFAKQGFAAPTSAISRAAGIAEGTLFTYFKTKDDLVNELYRQIKLELADAMMSGYPRKKSIRHRLQHVWDGYVNWGLANPPERKVLKQLLVSNSLTSESREAGASPFREIETMTRDAFAQHMFADLPQEFVAEIFGALAETTMDFINANPKAAAKHQRQGFEVLWAGITRKQ